MSRKWNEYNFGALENSSTYEPTRCAECHRVIRLGYEGHTIKDGDYFCMDCADFPGALFG